MRMQSNPVYPVDIVPAPERWGQYGLGSQETHPEIGPVHLAAGYLLQEMLGCRADYRDGHPPQVICAQQEQLHVDPEAAFAKIPGLHFVDVGSGSDVQILHQALPQTFLNLRLDPVKLRERSPDQIHILVHRLARDSSDPALNGLCCINMDDTVTDEQISAIFEAAGELRQNAKREAT